MNQDDHEVTITVDRALVEKLARQVDDIHQRVVPKQIRGADGEPSPPVMRTRAPSLASRVQEEMIRRQRATVDELAMVLNEKRESVRVTLYELRKRGACARVGRTLWASAYVEGERKPSA